MKKPVVLRIFKGEQLLGVKQFADAQIVLGKPGDVQVPLEGERVSLIHAAIEERDSGFFICDLGSETGTFKNGEAVLDSPIESGDIIQVGEFRIEFFIGAPKPKAAPSATSAAPAPSEPAKPVISVVQTKEQAPFDPQPAPRNPAGGKPSRPQATTTAAPSPVSPTPVQSPMPSPEISTPKAAGFSMAGPRASTPARGKGAGSKSHSKKEKTFAPPSKYKDVRDFVKPSKGTVVEVLVAWKERVIATRHFSKSQTVTIGSHVDSDIVLPILSSRLRKIPLLKIEGSAKVLVSPEMTGELVRGQASSSFVELLRQNKMVKSGASYVINLEQGEMVRLEMSDQISVIIRYTSDSPKPLVAPLFDLTTSEIAGIVLAGVLIAILRLYTFLYSPPTVLPPEEDQEPLRMALIQVPPTPKPLAPPSPPSTPAPTPEPTPAPIVRATPAPVPQPNRTTSQPKAQTSTNLTTKNDPGKSANAAPNRNKGPRSLTSPKQGGSIKTTTSAASQMNSAKRDVSKSGIFSAFGAGANDRIDQSHSGSGSLVGLSDVATGKSGMNEDRAGSGLGTATKDTGAGGTGKALTGIQGGIGTSGRGSGNSGYGTGGLGTKAGTKIVTGGTGEAYSGTIDREAIRRVIKANERTIRTCYERQLNRNPDLFGKLMLSWDIAEGGRVTAVRVASNEMGNADVANCILDRLKTWKFPDPPAGQVVDVTYPFFFSN